MPNFVVNFLRRGDRLGYFLSKKFAKSPTEPVNGHFERALIHASAIAASAQGMVPFSAIK
jgi:hypothetical protein